VLLSYLSYLPLVALSNACPGCIHKRWLPPRAVSTQRSCTASGLVPDGFRMYVLRSSPPVSPPTLAHYPLPQAVALLVSLSLRTSCTMQARLWRAYTTRFAPVTLVRPLARPLVPRPTRDTLRAPRPRTLALKRALRLGPFRGPPDACLAEEILLRWSRHITSYACSRYYRSCCRRRRSLSAIDPDDRQPRNMVFADRKPCASIERLLVPANLVFLSKVSIRFLTEVRILDAHVHTQVELARVSHVPRQ
jgi:hypothetical protein